MTKPCYYTFFSDECPSPLQASMMQSSSGGSASVASSQQGAAKQKFNPSTSGVPHFISKQEKERLKLNSKKTVSLAFIGMGNDNAMDIVNQILKKPVFYEKRKSSSKQSTGENFVLLNNVVNSGLSASDQSTSQPRKQHQVSIDSFHDVDQDRVYLFADLMQKPEHCKTFVEQFLPQKMSNIAQTNLGYQNILSPNTNHSFDIEHSIDYERVLQTLLFLFQTCHMIFFVLPSSQANGTVCSSLHHNLLSLLRTIQISKQYINSKVLDVIHQEKMPVSENSTMNMITTILGSPVMSSLYSPGRVLPVISFIFVQKRNQWNKVQSMCEQQHLNQNEDSNEYMLNRMQNGVENQVRNHILKKGKLSGVDSNKTPLFMLDPQTCTFVIVEPEEASEPSPYSTKVSLEQSRRAIFSLSDSGDVDNQKLRTLKPKKPSDKSGYLGVSKVFAFIQKQLDYFLKQMQTGKRFILPTSLNWYQATFAFEELFSLNNEELQKVLVEKCKDIIHPNFSFSDKRCSHAFKMATENFVQKVPTVQSSNTKVMELVNESISKYKTFACGYFTQYYNQQLQSFLQANTPKAAQVQQSKSILYQFYPNSPISHFTIQKLGDYNSLCGRNGSIRRENQIINFIQVHVLPRDKYQKRKKKKSNQEVEISSPDVTASNPQVSETLWIAFEYETPRKDCALTLDQLTQLYKQAHPQEATASVLDMIQKTNIPLFLPSHWFSHDKKSQARLKQVIIGIPDVDIPNNVIFSPKITVPVKQEATTSTTTNTAPSASTTKTFPLCHIKQGIVLGRNQFLNISFEYDSNQLNNYEDLTLLALSGNSIQIA